MRQFIDKLVRRFFEKCSQDLWANATFVEFIIDGGDPSVENAYPVDVYGHIEFVSDGVAMKSRPFRVQYFQCQGDHPNRPIIIPMFLNELHFYEQIWPLCCNNATRNLVPIPKVSDYRLDDFELSMGAIIFECDYEYERFHYVFRYDYQHLEVMAWYIGQFHGRVLEMRARHGPELLAAVNALAPRPQLEAGPAIQKLRYWISRLRNDPNLEMTGISDAETWKLEELVADLPNRLQTQPAANSPFFVLCHGSYVQRCCFFRFIDECTPVQARIGYWGMVGWGSLADDLVILLLTGAKSWVEGLQLRLVDQYHKSLKSVCSHHLVPSQDDIWREIKLRIPVALHSLAFKVNPRLRLSGKMLRWKDDFVVHVFKFLLRADLV